MLTKTETYLFSLSLAFLALFGFVLLPEKASAALVVEPALVLDGDTNDFFQDGVKPTNITSTTTFSYSGSSSLAIVPGNFSGIAVPTSSFSARLVNSLRYKVLTQGNGNCGPIFTVYSQEMNTSTPVLPSGLQNKCYPANQGSNPGPGLWCEAAYSFPPVISTALGITLRSTNCTYANRVYLDDVVLAYEYESPASSGSSTTVNVTVPDQIAITDTNRDIIWLLLSIVLTMFIVYRVLSYGPQR